jgi:ParB-like chromosome segregation protein Spo0J
MNIETKPLNSIRPYERNPRVNEPAVDAVARSIEAYGFRQPIVVDPQGVIVVGHTRFLAAQKLGLKNVPVHVATDLSPEQAKAYRIADNKSAELAMWDFDLLPIELQELRELDINLELLGFGADELAKILGEEVKDGLTDPDAVPEPPDEATTKRGELIILGTHRLLCGDSSSEADVDLLLEGHYIIASILRGCGDTLQRNFGPEALDILNDALDDAEREINTNFRL